MKFTEPNSRTAIVTGGAFELAKCMHPIAVVCSRSKDKADQTVTHIKAAGFNALAIRAEVAVDADCHAMMEKALEAFGRVDLLINCTSTSNFIPFDDLELAIDEVWERLLRVNVLGAFHCARAAMIGAGAESS